MKALMKFTRSSDPVFTHPFTLVDRQGSVWTIATDKIWLVASKGPGTAPRFSGGAESLPCLLNILHYEPKDTVQLPTKVTVEDNVCSVLGVTVVTKRFQDLLSEAPAESRLWKVEGLFPGLPGIGISTASWRAVLMGFTNVVGEIPVIDIAPDPVDLFDLAMGLD